MEYELQEPQSEQNQGGAIEEDTVLIATLIAIKEEEKTNKQNEKYKRLSWRFRVNMADSEYDGRSVFGETSTAFVRHSDCKFYVWSQMVMGVEFPPGFKINTDLLLEQDCRIVVGARPYVKDGEDRIHNFISDVMPLDKMVEAPF